MPLMLPDPEEVMVRISKESMMSRSFSSLAKDSTAAQGPVNYSLGVLCKEKRFRPDSWSCFTIPFLPIGSVVLLESCCSVLMSPWLATNRSPLSLMRPTMKPRDGLPLRSYSTVYV